MKAPRGMRERQASIHREAVVLFVTVPFSLLSPAVYIYGTPAGLCIW